MALTPQDYHGGEGVFVASKGKVSLIVDVDRDGKADKEIIVAQGWKELPHGVDALGVALDSGRERLLRAGNDRLHQRLSNRRRRPGGVRPEERARHDPARLARFPASARSSPRAFAFRSRWPSTAHGDLFATDQEGATWLANGNPFDELLHIQPNRHYGFPPRHPRHLPSVIDEPSVFDYGPQHQSTCGLNFNEPVNGGPTFGPAQWAGDALVTGYSRGKLFRTKLVKTRAATSPRISSWPS